MYVEVIVCIKSDNDVIVVFLRHNVLESRLCFAVSLLSGDLKDNFLSFPLNLLNAFFVGLYS